MRPLVSVVIPTRGSERHRVIRERCLPSLAAQTYPNLEVIVVSGDPDPQLGLELTQLGIFHLECPEDHSLADVGSQARNFGAAQAIGEFITYLDDDSALRPQCIERLVGMLEADPSLDFVYPRFYFHYGDIPDPEVLDTRGDRPPGYCTIDCTAITHRQGFLERFGQWPVPNIYPDAQAANRWLKAGARWGFCPECLFDYYASTPGLHYPGRDRGAALGWPLPPQD
jgi:glycosyltransferase involved in cell wall biosynthesis